MDTETDLLTEIETERLILRVPRQADVAGIDAAIRETQDDLWRWVAWVRGVPSIADTATLVERFRADAPTGRDYAYYAFLKGDNAFAAGLNLFAVDPAVPQYEIGYWCRRRFQGRGYVSEAVRALTRFGVETLKANRIQIRCDVDNTRSTRVAERAGYRREATLENDRRTPDGRLGATAVYVVLPRDYARSHDGRTNIPPS